MGHKTFGLATLPKRLPRSKDSNHECGKERRTTE